MPPDSFLHERSDFKHLSRPLPTANRLMIQLSWKKDYWIMHDCLSAQTAWLNV
jgi:hypothetical protein